MMLIKGGRVFTMAGDTYECGDVLIDNGKILEVGLNINRDCETIDARGKWVVPGFIEAHCHIGMEEQYIGSAGDDVNEVTDPITPYLNGLDGVNFYEESFRDAVKAGITTVCTGPGSANVLGGTFSVLKTYGENPSDMVVVEKSAMKAALGENPKRAYGHKGKMPSTRMGIAYLLREALVKAGNYAQKRQAAERKGEYFERDVKLEELVNVLEGRMPLKIHVHRADDIMTAVRIIDEFNIKATLDHCSEGLLLMDEIIRRNIPAIVGPTMTFKRKAEVRGKTFATAGEFARSGILTAITTDHPVTGIQYLPLCAGLCVKEGMDFQDALKAITINPAKILGIDKRVGSIEPGKDADIALFDGNPLEVMTKTDMVMINGKIVYRMGE